MKKKLKKKLELNRETVRTLSNPQIAVGGTSDSMTIDTLANTCETCQVCNFTESCVSCGLCTE